ncbi:hypothetical protein BKA65DRAFT_405590, partial [Rhexocercosporidium sp. MPI-PUGE-AT-0058]
FTLVARYCSLFVNIHLVGDGNGRLCGMLMNASLLEKVRIRIYVGEEGEGERDE